MIAGQKLLLSSRLGFTLVELLVVVGVVGILAAILIPASSKAISSAQSASCSSRLRAIGLAIAAFSADHDQYLPTNGNSNPFNPGSNGSYFSLVGPYLDVANLAVGSLRDYKLFRCPEMDKKPDVQTSSAYMYTYNTLVGTNPADNGSNASPVALRLVRVARPDNTPLLWDCAGDKGSDTNPFLPTPAAKKYGYAGATSSRGLSPNHGPVCKVLFVSGRVDSVDLSSINNFPWNGVAPPKDGKDSAFDPIYAGK